MVTNADPIQFMQENRSRKLDDIETLNREGCSIKETFNGSTIETTEAEVQRLSRQVEKIETILAAFDAPFDD